MKVMMLIVIVGLLSPVSSFAAQGKGKQAPVLRMSQQAAVAQMWKQKIPVARLGNGNFGILRDKGVTVFAVQPGAATDVQSLRASAEKLERVPHGSIFYPAE